MQLEFDAGNDKTYKFDGIWNSAVYARKLIGQLLGLYYLVSWKGYFEEKNTWEPALAIQCLQKLVSAYYKNNTEKPTVISVLVNMAPSIARPIATLTKKSGQPVGSTTTIQ